MRRLRSWSGSPRSRARESIAKSTFIRKTHMIWKTFFRVFAERSQMPYIYNELSPSRGPSFHNFDSKMAELHFWPKRGQWDPMWSEFDSIWIKFDPNWVKLGPNEAQSIFTNSRSTAQADVMLYMGACASHSPCFLKSLRNVCLSTFHLGMLPSLLYEHIQESNSLCFGSCWLPSSVF